MADIEKKKNALPRGMFTLEPEQMRVAIEHCRKMIRDGFLSHTWGVLNVAIALHNIRAFGLFRAAEMEYDSFAACAEAEFGLAKTQSNQYATIGESIASQFGGGFVAQDQIEEALSKAVLQSRVGFRKMHLLSKTAMGMQKLLSSKSDTDISDVITELREGALELKEEADSKTKTPLKAALGKRYSHSNLPSQTDMTMMIGAVLRQVKELNTKYVAKLAHAINSLPEFDDMRKSVKHLKQMQQVWNELRVLGELLDGPASLWPDAVQQARAAQQRLAEVTAEPVQHAEVRGKRSAKPHPVQTVSPFPVMEKQPLSHEETEALVDELTRPMTSRII